MHEQPKTLYKSIAEIKAAAFEKYKTKDNTLETFKGFPHVKVITPCCDHYFFCGEVGKVTDINASGIIVEFDIPWKFEDGTVQKTFIFAPQDLITIYDFERFNENHSDTCTCQVCDPVNSMHNGNTIGLH